MSAPALLQDLLGPLREALETPLASTLDAHGLAAHVLARRASAGEPVPSLAVLDGAVRAALGGDRRSGPPAPPVDARGLATWVARGARALAEVDPDAASVLALRLDGADDRDIAVQLGLGPRLVARIAADIDAAWEAER